MSNTAVTPLAADMPAHHVQVVHIDAQCSLWIGANISLRHTNGVATFKRHLKTIPFTVTYGITGN